MVTSGLLCTLIVSVAPYPDPIAVNGHAVISPTHLALTLGKENAVFATPVTPSTLT